MANGTGLDEESNEDFLQTELFVQRSVSDAITQRGKDMVNATKVWLEDTNRRLSAVSTKVQTARLDLAALTATLAAMAASRLARTRALVASLAASRTAAAHRALKAKFRGQCD